MPVLGGIEATAAIKAALPAVNVLVLTMHDSAAVRSEAEQAGASEVLAKDLVEEALLPAILNLIKEKSE
jgi:DNA-binding NarL/FixJ family response regulator